MGHLVRRVEIAGGGSALTPAMLLQDELGDGYGEWLKREFGVGIKDLCTY